MAVLVEAISVIVRRGAINHRLAGGWLAFQHLVPNATLCYVYWDLEARKEVFIGRT